MGGEMEAEGQGESRFFTVLTESKRRLSPPSFPVCPLSYRSQSKATSLLHLVCSQAEGGMNKELSDFVT